MNIKTFIEESEREWNESELAKRINSLEAIAYINGFNPYHGETIPQHESRKLRELIEEVRNWAMNEIGKNGTENPANGSLYGLINLLDEAGGGK